MQAWYMRGSYRQYNYAKNVYNILRYPEDYTHQDNGYTVCTGFANDVYSLAFGTTPKHLNTYNSVNTPTYTQNYLSQTLDYITKNNCISGEEKDGCNGEYVLFYEKQNGKTYHYKNAITFDEFINYLKPGDLLTYTGHTILVYDIGINPNTNKKDVLLLHSTGGNKIFTKINPINSSVNIRQLYYYNYKRSTNNILDLSVDNSIMKTEGTVKYRWLSDIKEFVNNGNIKCNKTECSIIRFFYKDGYYAKFNYEINEDQYNDNFLRTKLNGIFINKTSSAYDNNSIYPNQTITYNIEIVNNSNMNKVRGGINYSTFYVEEIIPNDKVFFISSSDGGVYNDNTLTWKINSLNIGEKINLQYKVQVKDTTTFLNQKVDSIGKIYIDNSSSIPTGKISNKIIRKIEDKSNLYNECFQKNKDEKGVNLIDKIYNCVYNENFEFNKFMVEKDNLLKKLIYVDLSIKTVGGYKKLDLINDEITNKYYDMVLNDYWNSLPVYNVDNNYIYSLPAWTDTTFRATTIDHNHFKNGDVLIYYVDNTHTSNDLLYTNEDGLYAYIYIDGKFVGNNYDGLNKRDLYTFDYYEESERKTKLYDGEQTIDMLTYANYQSLFGKDYYVILRPEKIIKELDKIIIKTLPNKLVYETNESLDLTGGVISLYYNDGEIKDVLLTDKNVKVSNFDNKKYEEQVLSVTYKNKTTNFNVSVVNKKNNNHINFNPETSSVIKIIIFITLIIIITFLTTNYKRII